eukprot:scaffold23491_cov66-Phaeocystis_antarctica.AAC.6
MVAYPTAFDRCRRLRLGRATHACVGLLPAVPRPGGGADQRGQGLRGRVPGENSPFRERSVADNLRLFEQMTAGELPDGAAVVRLKIDMAAGNMNLRDPPIYRIKRDADHPMTGAA